VQRSAVGGGVAFVSITQTTFSEKSGHNAMTRMYGRCPLLSAGVALPQEAT